MMVMFRGSPWLSVVPLLSVAESSSRIRWTYWLRQQAPELEAVFVLCTLASFLSLPFDGSDSGRVRVSGAVARGRRRDGIGSGVLYNDGSVRARAPGVSHYTGQVRGVPAGSVGASSGASSRAWKILEDRVSEDRVSEDRVSRVQLWGGSSEVRASGNVSVDVGMGACLVIGESGADWSAGIATARRYGPNLALVTQWVGEAPQHFSQRVISRLSKRRSFAAIIMVCNQRNDTSATEARQDIVRATAGAMSDFGDREITLICSPTRGGGIPPWAPLLAEHLPRQDEPLGLTVELAASL